MLLDTATEFGQRAERRLNTDTVGWLTTVRRDGTPLPTPIWFLWDGQSLLIYSQPNAQKLRNIANNPRVAVNLNGDAHGGDIIIITGTARIDESAPPADQNPPYVTKYTAGIAQINMTPEAMGKEYSTAIRITPDRIHGH
jgi:PPOX class probable F420-dependent enzyme